MYITQLKKEIFKKKENNNEIFQKEFQEIVEINEKINFEPDGYNLEDNKPKNRYGFIHGYKHSAVLLKQEHRNGKNSRYINASYIKEANGEVKFIATQAPLANTFEDFWRMVWEQNSSIIVMLANTDKGQCDIYWPEEGSIVVGDYVITLQGEENAGEYRKRKFALKKTIAPQSEVRSIFHFHYECWPDRNVPHCTTGLIQLHENLNITLEGMNAGKSSKPPVIIHCSAGVGRTGTFICFDIISELISKRETFNAKDVVLSMRRNRTLMVQNLVQYVFVHQMILDKVIASEMSIPCSSERRIPLEGKKELAK